MADASDVNFAADSLVRCLRGDAEKTGLAEGHLEDRIALVEFLRRVAAGKGK